MQCPIGEGPISPEEWPPPEPGPMESLLGRFVRLPAGYRRLPLLDSTVWTFLPCRHGCYLFNVYFSHPSGGRGYVKQTSGRPLDSL